MGNIDVVFEVTVDSIVNSAGVMTNITREEVDRKDFTRFMKTLESFEAAGVKARGKMFLTFYGYDDDPAEIYEIQSIREWIQEAFKICPHLFYFVITTQNYNSCILSCLGDLTKTAPMPFGEPMTALEYRARGVEPPDVLIALKIPKELENQILKSIIDYGISIGDSEDNIMEMVHSLTKFFR